MLQNNNTATSSVIVTKPYNNVYDFGLNIRFDTLSNNITFVASDDGTNNGAEASSAVTLQLYDLIYQFIIDIDPATTICQTYTDASGVPSAITMTTQFYSPSPSPSPSTINPGNLSPSSYDLSSNNPSSSNNDIGNNLSSISNSESNADTMAAPAVMAGPYYMT